MRSFNQMSPALYLHHGRPAAVQKLVRRLYFTFVIFQKYFTVHVNIKLQVHTVANKMCCISYKSSIYTQTGTNDQFKHFTHAYTNPVSLFSLHSTLINCFSQPWRADKAAFMYRTTLSSRTRRKLV